MKKSIYSNEEKLICSGCGNYHYQFWMFSHQKKLSKRIGCASIMSYNSNHNYYEIFSQYGSGYDTAHFQVLRTLFPRKNLSSIGKLIEKVNHNEKHHICDKCIQRFIHRNYIVMLNSWF